MMGFFATQTYKTLTFEEALTLVLVHEYMHVLLPVLLSNQMISPSVRNA